MRLIKKMVLPLILILMGYAFWRSDNIEQIAAGIAIFLFGMLAIEDGFQKLSGGFLERFLRSFTNKLWKSLNFGIITTTLMQSSSLVSILTISFLSAGLISLAAGIGIIFGANLGTTTGAWLLAGFGLKVKLSVYAMPMLAFGVVLILQNNNKFKAVGWVVAGVGFLFMGIQHMKDGFEVMKDSINLATYAMTGIKGLLMYTLLGIVATVVMQSSHATLVLIITALASGQISYENALALSIGANVGTTVTAIIGSISANIDGKRLAVAHLIFNLITALVAIFSMKLLLLSVEWLGDFLQLSADNYTLRLAIFHTMFNLLGIILVTPFIKLMIRFLYWVLPEKQIGIKLPKFLNQAVLESEQATVMAVHQESIRLYDLSLKVIANGLGFKKPELLEKVTKANISQYNKPLENKDINEAYASRIKQVFSSIVEFVVIAREKISGKHAKSLQIHSRAVRELALAIKAVKHLQKNLNKQIKGSHIEVQYLYNQLRWLIVETVRKIEKTRLIESSEETSAILKALKKANERKIKNIIKEVESSIRKQLITAQNSTSLITDTEYTHRACNLLVDVAKKLFIPEKTQTAQGTEQTQDQTELHEILHD
ncbi:MAG: Na/Pi cotransporter family protein [Xanthomonadales bacterium]|nr:Na/Pi cotransporter family protein [Xanthomonadales bacterium]